MATQKKFIADLGFETPSDLTVNGNATIDGNATVTGNLTVNGTSTTVNSTTTSVTDSMIELANANTGSDTLDIGIYGNYDDGLSDGGASEYTGLFRDASDSTWKLFDGLESEPTTTVNIAGTGYAKAALEVGDLSCTTLTATNSMTGASLSYPTSDGSAGQVIKTDGNGTLSFTTISGYTDSDVETYLNTSTIYTDPTNNRLGIGTSSPDVALDISQTSARVKIQDETNQLNIGLWDGTNHRIEGDANRKLLITSYHTDGIHLGGSGNSHMVIKGGNVGVGETSPVAKLHVQGTGTSGQVTSSFLLENASSGTAGMDITGAAGSSRLRFLYGGGPSTGTNTLTEALNIVLEGSSAGNVGIGQSSPNAKLDVKGEYSSPQALIGYSDGDGIFIHAQGGSTHTNWCIGQQKNLSGLEFTPSTTAGGTTFSNPAMVIEEGGDVGIGITNATSRLHVDAGTYAGYAVDLVQGGSGGGNHGLRVVSGSGSSYTAIFRANASTVFYVDGAGNYYFSGSNQSDVNKKENIADITDSALDLITQLQPKTYNFIGSDIDKAGFIAQDMETVIPRLVTGNTYDASLTDEDGNNPTGKGIDYMGYTAYLTKAIQELKVELDAAKARIETLESA